MVLLTPVKSLQNGAGFSRKNGTNWACQIVKSGLSSTNSVVKGIGASFSERKRNGNIGLNHKITIWESQGRL